MYNFFVEQLERRVPFNFLDSYALFFRPLNSRGQAYFCSQLVTDALRAGGVLEGVASYAVSPASLYSILHARRGEFTSVLDTENPVLEE